MPNIWILAALPAILVAPVSPSAPQPPVGAPAASEGVIDLRIGEPVDDMLSRSSFQFANQDDGISVLHTGSRVGVRYRFQDRVLDLPGIGGMENTVLLINLSYPNQRVASLSFSYQDRPLQLAEAMARAQELRRWFEEAGFVQPREVPGERDRGPFRVAEQARGLSDDPRPENWESAERLLADGSRMVAAMDLFTLAAAHIEVSVSVRNWVREGALRGFDSIYANNGGREWGLDVHIGSDRMLVEE